MAATLTKDGEITYASFPIIKMEETSDGDVIVYGKATDGSVDSDEQIVDPEWSAKGLQEWLETAGNVRVQHNPTLYPAGKGISVEASTDGHYVKSLIVEPTAKELVKKGVLTAYSVGIARPTIVRDRVARGGRITNGQIVEISLVDRPANKNCGIQLVKAAKDGTPEFTGKVWGAADLITKGETTVTLEIPKDVTMTFTPSDLAKIVNRKNGSVTEVAEKRNFDRNVGGGVDRDKIPASDFAGRDRSFPIVTAGDVSDALHSIGRAGADNYDAKTLRRNIIRIARRKGFPVPDSDKPKKSKRNKSMDELEALKAEIEALKGSKRIDPDHDGDNDATPEGDTDHDYWTADGKQKKPLPASAKGGTLSSPAGDDDADDGDGDGDYDSNDDSSGSNGNDNDSDDSQKGLSFSDSSYLGLPSEVGAIMRLKNVGVPVDEGRLHDLTCPAFNPEDVEKCYPGQGFESLNDFYWQQKALDFASAGSLDEAVQATSLWGYAQALKTANPADLLAVRQQLHKAFQDANPGPGHAPTPSGQLHPGSYNRPFISSDHADPAAGNAYQGPNSAHVPTDSMRASSFGRDYLSSGHAADSPSTRTHQQGVSGPSMTGHLQPSDFGSVPRANYAQAMNAIHDHIAQTFPDLCPLKPEGVPTPVRNPVPTPGSTPRASAAKSDGDRLSELDSAVKALEKQLLKDSLKASSKTKLKGKGLADVQETLKELRAEIAEKSRSESAEKAEPQPPVTLSVQSGISKEELSEVTQALITKNESKGLTRKDVKDIIAPIVAKMEASNAKLAKAQQPALTREVIQEIAGMAQVQKPTLGQDEIAAITAPLLARLDSQERALAEATASKKTDPSHKLLKELVSKMSAPTQPQPQFSQPQHSPHDTELLVKSIVTPLVEKLETRDKPQAPDTEQLVKSIVTPLVKKLDSQTRQPKEKQQNVKKLVKEVVAPLVAKMEANAQRPEDTERIVKSIVAPLAARIEAQAQANRPEETERIVREIVSPIVQRMEAQAQQSDPREMAYQITSPLIARLEAQEKKLKKREKDLLRQQQESLEKALQAIQTQDAESAAQLPPGVITQDQFSAFAAGLQQQLVEQQRQLRKEQRELRRQQIEQLEMLSKSQAMMASAATQPAPDDGLTPEAVSQLVEKLEAQPGVTKEALAEITERLEERLEDRLRQQQTQATLEKMSQKLDRRPELPREALDEITRPLMSRLEAQERMLRKQEKRLKRQELEARFAALTTPMQQQAQQPGRPSFYGKAAGFPIAPESTVVKKLKKQQRQLREELEQREAQLKAELQKRDETLNRLANLPDPSLAPFRGMAADLYKGSSMTTATADAAQSMAEVAERTQAMLLSELEMQFRTSPDPAQREAAWRQMMKIRHVPDQDN